MFCVVTIVLLSPEPDLSIIDVDTEQSQAGAGRHTDRVPDPRAPGGENMVFLFPNPTIAEDSPVFPGKPEYFLVRFCAAIEFMFTGSSQVAAWQTINQPTR